MKNGFIYLTADRLKQAIINSDRGSQYTSQDCTELLNQLEIKISMDGKGRAIDHAFIERFETVAKAKLQKYSRLSNFFIPELSN